MRRRTVVIAGAGPAGMMAAIAASSSGADVLLLEKNERPGRKLLLTGNGRCNFTNNCDMDALLSAFSKGGPFLRDAFKEFSNKDLMDFFRKRGLMSVEEEHGRVFPVDHMSSSVLKTLTDELRKNGVKIITGVSIENTDCSHGHVFSVRLSDGSETECRSLILATGGVSYRRTGSTGDGLRLAVALGHDIIALRPGLVPILLENRKYPSFLEGLSLRDIAIRINSGKGRRSSRQNGDIIFTSRGISGPLAFSLSGTISDLLAEGQKISLYMDVMPQLSEDDVDSLLLERFHLAPGRNALNLLKDIIPARLAGLFADIAGMGPDLKCARVMKSERRTLVGLIKGWKLDVKAVGKIDDAMVTRGGVSRKDIDPRTMESRRIKGLYFAGEIIDIDGKSGGFNLQAAFSTGYLAGKSAGGR